MSTSTTNASIWSKIKVKTADVFLKNSKLKGKRPEKPRKTEKVTTKNTKTQPPKSTPQVTPPMADKNLRKSRSLNYGPRNVITPAPALISVADPEGILGASVPEGGNGVNGERGDEVVKDSAVPKDAVAARALNPELEVGNGGAVAGEKNDAVVKNDEKIHAVGEPVMAEIGVGGKVENEISGVGVAAGDSDTNENGVKSMEDNGDTPALFSGSSFQPSTTLTPVPITSADANNNFQTGFCYGLGRGTFHVQPHPHAYDDLTNNAHTANDIDGRCGNSLGLDLGTCSGSGNRNPIKSGGRDA